MHNVDFLFFDAGGGHRSAATALKRVMEKEGYPWNIRLVNLQDVLDEIDLFHKYTGIASQDIYNLILKKGWTLGSPQLARIMQWIIRRFHADQVRVLSSYWRRHKPDMVVSLIPNFGRAIYKGLKSADPDAPLVTILTDFADYAPLYFWIERQDQYYICGTELAIRQAYELGHPPEKVFRVQGMILHPRYYERIDADPPAERLRLGLQPDLPTGLVLFGGQGSPSMRRILDRLDRSSLNLQLILLCGKNAALARDLRARRTRIPVLIQEFTTEVPYFMHLSDFFIGKPGPGSISEALAMRLPVIVERNAYTLPQERYNAEWVLENQVGMVVRNFRRIDETVAALLEPETFQRLRTNAAALRNTAVYEIPAILDGILRKRRTGSDAAR
ncbi:MAG: glycosyltransferase [Bryobacteraceae bacterium]